MNVSRNWRKLVWTTVALFLAVGTALALREPPLAVRMARVASGDLAATVSGEGRTRVRDLYLMSAPVDGNLERIAAQLGDPVNAGDVVAKLRPLASRPLDPRTRAEATAAVTSAKLSVERAEAAEREARVALDHANSQLETAQSLAQGGALPPNELTHAGHAAAERRSALDAAIAAAGQTRADLARARAVLEAGSDTGESVLLRAPINGKVLRVLQESAGPVAAGTPLLELGDVQRLDIEADLLSSDAAQVRPGAPAMISGWGGSPFEARVRRIAPGAFTKISALGLEEQRVHVLLDFISAPPPELGHAYHVDVAVVVWDGHGVPRVPSLALFRAADGWAAFLVRSGRAQSVPVETGPSDGNWTVVTSGLRVGDEVIAQPSDAIRDGTRVRAE